MDDQSELLARLSQYRLMQALMSRPDDRAVIDEHIARLEQQLEAGDPKRQRGA